MSGSSRKPGGNKIEGTIGAKSIHATARGVRVTDGGSVQGVTLKAGRDYFAPATTEVSKGYVNVGGGYTLGTQRKAPVDHMATARTVTEAKTAKYGDLSEVTNEGRGVFTETVTAYAEGVSAGKITRRVRTVDMGDDTPLPHANIAMLRAVQEQAEQARKPRKAGKPSSNKRSAEDAEVAKYLKWLGYKGEITPQVRSLALDALAHRATVAEYAAEVS